MKKKLFIIVSVVLLTVALFVVFQPKNKSTEKPTLASPAPTSAFVQPKNVAFSFATPPTIPASLPTYTFTAHTLTSLDPAISNAATSFGIPTDPTVLLRGGAYTKTWAREGEVFLKLTGTGDITSIVFLQPKATQGAQTMQQFLSTIIPTTRGVTVEPAGTSDGPFDGLLVLDTPPPTPYKNYYYQYVMGGYPLLSQTLSITPISIVVDKSNVVRSATIIPPPATIQTSESVSTITTDQILASLTAGRGTLLTVSNPLSPEQGLVPTFSTFTIRSSRVVYGQQGNIFLPGLYLEGAGVSPTGEKQNATIFLWLTPQREQAL